MTLAISVSDTGIGIAPEVIDRIFTEFTQASYETSMRFGGSGLGLTITRKLLALYGSAVDVRARRGRDPRFRSACDWRCPGPDKGRATAALDAGGNL